MKKLIIILLIIIVLIILLFVYCSLKLSGYISNSNEKNDGGLNDK